MDNIRPAIIPFKAGTIDVFFAEHLTTEELLPKLHCQDTILSIGFRLITRQDCRGLFIQIIVYRSGCHRATIVLGRCILCNGSLKRTFIRRCADIYF